MQPWGMWSTDSTQKDRRPYPGTLAFPTQADVGAHIDAVPALGGKTIDSRRHTIEPILEIPPHRTDNNFLGRDTIQLPLDATDVEVSMAPVEPNVRSRTFHRLP